MRPLTACLLVLTISACSTTDRPPTVGGGSGSEFGNYAAREEGETRGPSGERCVVFAWDRPLSKDHVIRLRSQSCESSERRGWMICRELSREVVPMSESHLRDEDLR